MVRRMIKKAPWLALLLAGACARHTRDDAPPPPSTTEAPVYLSPARYLVRVSMAVRGTRPSTQDLDDVERDPAAIERIVDGYLESDAFGAMLRDLHEESL